MNNLFKALDLYIIPGLLIVIWTELYFTSEVQGTASIGMAMAFALVVLLYWTYRKLRVHAAASRMAANGDPDELLELADDELTRKYTARSKLPLQVYRAIALTQRGDFAEAAAALDAIDMTRIPTSARRTWGVIAASVRVQIAVAQDDAATARAVYDRDLAPALRNVRGGGADVLGHEAEALVLFAEGERERARPMFDRMARDIRVGQATRALCRYYAGRCGDDASARAAAVEAAKLAPKTWLARQNEPVSASPTPSDAS